METSEKKLFEVFVREINPSVGGRKKWFEYVTIAENREIAEDKVRRQFNNISNYKVTALEADSDVYLSETWEA